MPREIPVPLINKNFIQEALEQGHRLDGRKPLQRRSLVIEFPDPQETSVAGLGRVEVSLGKTRVLARVSAALTNPRSDRPFEGLLSITSEIGPLAGEAFHGEGR
jgi:exosome complex component RRP45